MWKTRAGRRVMLGQGHEQLLTRFESMIRANPYGSMPVRRPQVTIARLMIVVAVAAVLLAAMARGHGGLVVGLMPMVTVLAATGRRRLLRAGVAGRVGVLVVLYTASATLTYAAAINSRGEVSEQAVPLVTMGAILGPLTGAMLRHWQSCCLRFSLDLLPYCGAALGLGLLFQVIPLPFQRFQRGVRLAAWTCGWTVWFLGIPISFLHALS